MNFQDSPSNFFFNKIWILPQSLTQVRATPNTGLWDQGVYSHFCDTREAPPLYGISLWKALFVVSQKGSFPCSVPMYVTLEETPLGQKATKRQAKSPAFRVDGQVCHLPALRQRTPMGKEIAKITQSLGMHRGMYRNQWGGLLTKVMCVTEVCNEGM